MMKKAFFTLAILVVAFGNVSFAQRKANLKLDATTNVLKHYGVRDEATVVPQTAAWETVEGDKYRTSYTYDEYDFYLNEEYTEVKFDNNWSDFSLLTYQYDFYGNVLEILAQLAENGDWVNEAQAFYSYENEELSEVIIQYWENGDWVNETKEVYNYNGDVTTVLFWDWNGNNWTSNELYTYTNNGDGTIELLIQYMQGGAWQNDEKQLITLNFDEKVEEIIVQDWVGTSWVNAERTTYAYDGGVFTEKIIENWNGSDWEDDYKYVYEYDDGNAKHGECLKMESGSWISADGDIEMAYGYSEESKEYYGWRVEVEYVDLTAVDEKNHALSFEVFPVPAENEIIVQSERFQKAEIFNLTGQKLMESVQDRIDVNSLPSGVYVIKVFGLEGDCATQRFVVK